MITFPKVKAAGYAITKRLQGYHLLKNPKGTPQTEVNMVKEWYGISGQWDDVFHIDRIKKVYTEQGSEKETKLLMATHFLDGKKLKMTSPRKKDIYYSVSRNGEYSVTKEREDIPWESNDKRSSLKLSLKRSSFLTYDSEYDKLAYKKREAQFNRGYYKTHYSLLTKIVSLGMHKRMAYPTENRPNFFKVLYQNLRGK